ncbi:MAG: DUF5666 domain-containing protein [Proteobacteria bacterium]|nr:DUF5666 domain-containing protein [Pseudomonadota bacterium]
MTHNFQKKSPMQRGRFAKLRTTIAVVSLAFITAACGGGGLATLLADVGSGGTGARMLGFGIITGFGSLILDGVRRDDKSASYTSESTQGSAVSVPLTSAVLGQHVEYTYDTSGNVTSVLLSPEFVGPVSAVSATSITMLGTRIIPNKNPSLGPVTSFTGYASLADIKVGDSVEAHGFLRTDDLGNAYLQATLIMKRTSISGVRFTGVIAQYNANAGSFILGTATVTSGSAIISPAGSTLANGQLVTVWSNLVPNGNSITASTIRIKNPTANGGNVTISGPIAHFVSLANFQVGNMTVDASAGKMTPGDATLADNQYVVVAGSFDTAKNTLKADTVTAFTTKSPTTVELHGVVGSYVSAASFMVRGVNIDASAASAFSGGSPSQLANGVYVEIHGTIANNVVHATSVDIQALTPTKAPNGSVIQVNGVISSYDSASGNYTMTLDSDDLISGTLGSAVSYSNGIAANLVVGQPVTVTGELSGSSLSGKTVSFENVPKPASGIRQLSGVAYNVTASSFMLNGLTIQINGTVVSGDGVIGGGPGLVSGSHVVVNVNSVGGQYLATAIALDDD